MFKYSKNIFIYIFCLVALLVTQTSNCEAKGLCHRIFCPEHIHQIQTVPYDTKYHKQYSIITNENVSIKKLKKLSISNYAEIRTAVAKHQKTNSDILNNLSFDFSVMVRKTVAENINTSNTTLIRLKNSDSSESVRNSANKTLLYKNKSVEYSNL